MTVDNAASSRSQLASVFYCDFHPTLGPRLCWEYASDQFFFTAPDSTHSDQEPPIDFDSISDYLIPKSVLCGHVLGLGIPGTASMLIGCPQAIEDAKYERNMYLFNLGFILTGDGDSFTGNGNGNGKSNDGYQAYRYMVWKLARNLRHMEVEGHHLETDFLSRQVNDVSLSPGPLFALMKQLVQDMNAFELNGGVSGAVDEANTLHLKLIPCAVGDAASDVDSIKNHEVPVSLISRHSYSTGQSLPWNDLSLIRVFGAIDGCTCVKRLIDQSGVDETLAKLCLGYFRSIGVVRFMDQFHWSNLYRCTRKVLHASTPDHWTEAIQYATLPGGSAAVIQPCTVLRLMQCLDSGQTLQEAWDHLSDRLGHLDARRFVAFAVLKGWLRRVHRYPMLHAAAQCALPASIQRLLDHGRCMDELAVLLDHPYESLEALMSADAGIRIYQQ